MSEQTHQLIQALERKTKRLGKQRQAGRIRTRFEHKPPVQEMTAYFCVIDIDHALSL